MGISCIIYDLDGTLIDSAEDIAHAVNRVRASYALPELDTMSVRGFIGDGADRLIERAFFGLVGDPARRPAQVLPRGSADPAHVLAQFKAVYAEDPVIRTTLRPGVAEALHSWHRRGVAQVVLTNKPHAITEAILAELGIAPLFDLVVGRGKTGAGGAELAAKPDPAVVDHILEQTGAERSETWMVGDGLPDIEVAAAAGIPCIVLLDGFTEPERLVDAAPDLDLVVTSFAAADELLRTRA